MIKLLSGEGDFAVCILNHSLPDPVPQISKRAPTLPVGKVEQDGWLTWSATQFSSEVGPILDQVLDYHGFRFVLDDDGLASHAGAKIAKFNSFV